MYAAPSFGNDPYRAATSGGAQPPFSAATRIVFTIFSVFGMLGFVGAIVGWIAMFASMEANHGSASRQAGEPDAGAGIAVAVAFTVLMIGLYGYLITGIVWMYKAWNWLPADQRYMKHWKGWISPSQASLFLLIPYFHYYWMFVINLGFCDAIDRMRIARGHAGPRVEAPKGLALAACITQLVIPLPVGMILWLVYMAKMEKMMREIAAAPVPQMPNYA